MVSVWMHLKAKQKRCTDSSDWSVIEKGKSRMGARFFDSESEKLGFQADMGVFWEALHYVALSSF